MHVFSLFQPVEMIFQCFVKPTLVAHPPPQFAQGNDAPQPVASLFHCLLDLRQGVLCANGRNDAVGDSAFFRTETGVPLPAGKESGQRQEQQSQLCRWSGYEFFKSRRQNGHLKLFGL